MNDIKSVLNDIYTSKQSTDKNTHLIQDNNFKNLITIQEEIYQATHVKPSLYKLINLIIEQANIQGIQEQLIRQYQ